MRTEKRLYRVCGTPLGGVCAGVAEYFGIDAVVARTLAVTGTLMTAGLLGVAYAAMVVVVPKAPECSSCYDVRPQEVVSDRFGPMSCPPRYSDHRTGGSVASSQYGHRGDRSYCGTGHIPPIPPAGVDSPLEGESPYHDYYQVK